MNEIDLSIDEIRAVLLELCKQASTTADDPERMVTLIDRITEIAAWYKTRLKPN